MDKSRPPRPGWFTAVTWLPVLTYFAVKYALFSGEMARGHNLALFAACILGSFALNRFGKHYFADPESDPDGTA